MGNLDLELVKDLLNGLHMGLQVFGFRRDTGQRSGKNRVQVELQDAVHSVAGKRRLERCESARVGMVLLSFPAHFLSTCWLMLRRRTYFKRFYDALVQKHYVQVIVCRLQRVRAVSRRKHAASPEDWQLRYVAGGDQLKLQMMLQQMSWEHCRLYSHSIPGC